MATTTHTPTPITTGEFFYPIDIEFMRQALACAKESDYIPTAFCVGCVVTTSSNHATNSNLLLSTGYSRELPGNTHAEQSALDKFLLLNDKYSEEWKKELLRGGKLYTTMEPCSVRMSGNTPCVQRILETEIRDVYVGVEEPGDFVECEGTRMLRENGRNVWIVKDPDDETLGDQCLKVARGEQ
ncbi:hypothetical protein JCM5353_007094 [Sporobolomyces roseus]